MTAASTEREGERGLLAFVTELGELRFAESADGGDPAVWVEVCRDGRWEHPEYGTIEVTPAMRERFAANFRANVRRTGDLPLDYDHQAGPAAGWIRGLRNEGSRLLAQVLLTGTARERIRAGEYRFFSPEWHPDWTDPETGARYGPTLFGGGLTNRPFFRGMTAIRCAESDGECEASPGGQGGAMAEEGSGVALAAPAWEGTEPAGMTAAEAQRLREEVQSLRAAEERRQVTETLSALRFSDAGVVSAGASVLHARLLAPASRTALADALLTVPAAARRTLLEALRSMRFVELGERGFAAEEPADEGISNRRRRQLLQATPLGQAALKSRRDEGRE